MTVTEADHVTDNAATHVTLVHAADRPTNEIIPPVGLHLDHEPPLEDDADDTEADDTEAGEDGRMDREEETVCLLCRLEKWRM